MRIIINFSLFSDVLKDSECSGEDSLAGLVGDAVALKSSGMSTINEY
jgi:hypothetical protein